MLVTGGSGFLGGWCAIELLRRGYRVRTTVRSLEREAEVRANIAAEIDPSDRLSVLAADLTADSGWPQAVDGCAYVLHVASPFPLAQPKNADELILPARDGTLRVLRAALVTPSTARRRAACLAERTPARARDGVRGLGCVRSLGWYLGADGERPETKHAAYRSPTPVNGADVIVIPGAWTRASAFDDVRDALRDGGRRTEVVELPSRASRLIPLDRGGLAAIDAVLDERIGRCERPPVLVGYSLGGLMALRAARRHAVRALVLLMPAPPAGMLPGLLSGAVRRPANTLRMLGAAFSVTLGGRLGFGPPDGLYSDRATAEDKARGVAYRTDESWLVLAALAIGSRKPVRPVGAPTLVVGGTQDGFTPTNVLRPLAEALDAEYAEFDVAHAFNEEPTYEFVTDAVLAFLDRDPI